MERIIGKEIEFIEIGKKIEKIEDLRKEKMVDLMKGGSGIIDSVVKKRDGDCRIVKMNICENRRKLKRMGEIGIEGRKIMNEVFMNGIKIWIVKKRIVKIRIV